MFIDEVMKKYPTMPRPDGIIKIQNVADYGYRICQEAKGCLEMDFKDVISIFPPFPITWMEYKVPNETMIAGILLLHFNKESVKMAFFFKTLYLDPMCHGGMIFTCDDVGKIISMNYAASKEIAQVFKNKDFESVMTECVSDFFTVPKKHTDDVNFNKIFWITMGETGAPLLALNFLHCKNVALSPDHIPQKLIKARKRNGKPYLEKTYTLQIETMKKILDGEGNAPKTGMQRALHICRGHFANYDEKPLFGKYTGTFWRPAHARGDSSIGKVNKDYEIKKIKL